MKKLIEDIKSLSAKQVILKNQRKTKNIKGARKIDAYEAAWKHSVNKHKLRVLYAALGKMRGKSFSEVENSYPELNHPLNEFSVEIDKTVKHYEQEEALRSSQ